MIDEPLSQDEVQQLIDVSVMAIYERAYNDAIDDVIRAVEEGNNLDDIVEWIRGLRKTCYASSSEKQ
jgi:hypothetical protein